MIISQTPYRVSFAGGGTDLPAFYRQEYGAVLSTTIDQHMYVTIHRRFEPTIRVSYSRTEMASTLDEVQHELVREAMRQVEIDEPLEITTIGDVPAGTGMGSSSSLTVGLLNALYAYRHRVVSPALLAEQACRIEIDILKKPIGRQDQYAAAFGGVNYIRFNRDDTVDVEPVPCRVETLTELEQRTLLVYTGQTRDANQILERQSNGTAERMDVLRQMRDQVSKMRAGADRRRRPRSVRVPFPRGMGAQAVAWLRDQQRSGQRVVRGRPEGGCRGRQAPRSRRWRISPLDGSSLAAPGNPRGAESPARASIPDRPPWQPEYLHPQLGKAQPGTTPCRWSQDRVKALLLAGGLGTRLRPLTDTIPKCLVPIADRPFLDFWIDRLAEAGIHEARVNTHALADQVRAYITKVNSEGRLHLVESYEPMLLGSAGTVTANADLADEADQVVIIYADNFSDIDLRPLLGFSSLPRRSADHGAFPRAQSPRLRDRCSSTRSGRIVSFVEKPEQPATDLANAGLYVVDAQALSPDRRDAARLTWASTFSPDSWGGCAAGFGEVTTWISELTKPSSERDKMPPRSCRRGTMPKRRKHFVRPSFWIATVL